MLSRDEILAVYAAGPEAVVALVQSLLTRLSQQQQQIDTLKKEQQQDREALLELQDLKKQIQELAAEIKPNKK